MSQEDGKGHPREEQKPEKVDSSGNTGHPERDQFIKGKIGSGFMSTIAGQPKLDEFAEEIGPGNKNLNKTKPFGGETPETETEDDDL